MVWYAFRGGVWTAVTPGIFCALACCVCSGDVKGRWVLVGGVIGCVLGSVDGSLGVW